MKLIKLKQVEWDNCFSFGSGNVVQLDSDSVTQIVAPNGFGKSSIMYIIEEALFNKNSKGVTKADIPNRYIGGGYGIGLLFEIGSDQYKIEIVRKSTLKVTLHKNGEDISSHKSPDTFKTICELLQMDFKTFQQLVNQSVNSSLQFLTATDTNRKKFLIDLFDLSEYVEYFESFKKAVNDLEKDVSNISTKYQTINKWLDNVELGEKLPVPDVDSTSFDFADKKSSIESNLKSIASTNAQISKNNLLKNKLDGFDDISTDEVTANKTKESYDDLQSEIGKLKGDKLAADALVEKVSKLNDKCPTCLQPIDEKFVEALKSENTEISNLSAEKMDNLLAEIQKIKSNNNLISEAEKRVAEYYRTKDNYDPELPDELLDPTSLNKELEDINRQIVNIQDTIKKQQAARDKAISHNANLEQTSLQKHQFEQEIAEVEAELKVSQLKLQRLELLKKGFSSNGLIAYKLENLTKNMESHVNDYLTDFSDGRFSIEFVLDKDKLNVKLTDDGRDISISSVSSGELARINTATLLGIRKIMSGLAKSNINILFLDEVISVLDDFGREKLVEILLKEEHLNTFIVSHSWTHPLVSKLVINKEEGISEIENG